MTLTAQLTGSIALEVERMKVRAAELRAQVAELQQRLEIATAPTFDDCPDDRTQWTFRFRHKDLREVERAIAIALGRELCHGDDRDADALAEVCRTAQGDVDVRADALWELCDVAGVIGQAIVDASTFVAVRGAQEHCLRLPTGRVEVQVDGPELHVEGQNGMTPIECEVRIIGLCVEVV